VKGTGYPLHSPVSPSLLLSCVTVCHHISPGSICDTHYSRPQRVRTPPPSPPPSRYICCDNLLQERDNLNACHWRSPCQLLHSFNKARFQSSASKRVRSALFCDITRRLADVSGQTHRGPSSMLSLDFLTLEDGTPYLAPKRR